MAPKRARTEPTEAEAEADAGADLEAGSASTRSRVEVEPQPDYDSDDDRPIFSVDRRGGGYGTGAGAGAASGAGSSCPYLDTVTRSVLDFDFEKVCSVSLTDHNVYCCLVCGRYFQGRGPSSHANFHALNDGHRVFLKLETKAVYCLPEGYEVTDSSLNDIKYVVDPVFTVEQVRKIDAGPRSGGGFTARCLDGTQYLPGYVGLNDLGQTDYVNAVVQALAHVPPLRNFFLIPANYSKCKSRLVRAFGELVRKLWNPSAFRPHVSPHELMQAITIASNKKYNIGKRADAIDFMAWLLHELHRGLRVKRRVKGKGGAEAETYVSSVIHDVFEGEVKVKAYVQQHILEAEAHGISPGAITGSGSGSGSGGSQSEDSSVKFLMLGLDIPPAPLFKDQIEQEIVIPQVPLPILLQKFNGRKLTYYPALRQSKQFKVAALPRHLVVTMKRLSRNNFFVEKNPTIVNFPVKNLEMRDFVIDPDSQCTKYNLIASLVHNGETGEKGIGEVEGETEAESYSIHVLHRGNGKWLEMQDLRVEETMPQLVALSQAYIQVYERAE